ncbi:MAG: folate family ECF transporter S component [Clostridiales bacterium]|nr:folate family ECF transporter S component [Clostridiales bacterium]
MKQLRRLVYAALLCAISIVLTRVLSLQLSPAIRLHLGNVPILLAGLWLGPLWGAAVGFAADFLGATLVSSLGWFAPLSLAPTLLGAIVALLSGRKRRFWRVIPAIIISLLICEVGIKPYALHLLTETPWEAVLAARLPFTALQGAAELALTIPLALTLTPLVRRKIEG